MTDVQNILEHKEALENLKSQKEAAQGSLNTYMEQLKEDYDCDSLEAAQELITSMKKELAEEEEKLEAAATSWEKKYAHLLEMN